MYIHIKSQNPNDRFNHIVLEQLGKWSLVAKDFPVQLLFTQGDEIYPKADIVIEIVSPEVIKVGRFLDSLESADSKKNNNKSFHWVEVRQMHSANIGIIPNFFNFLIGMIGSESQLGNYMVDIADLYAILGRGEYAVLGTLEKSQNFFQNKKARIIAMAVLMNSNAKLNDKYSHADECIPKANRTEDFLGIFNLTDNQHLSNTNTVLLMIDPNEAIDGNLEYRSSLSMSVS